MKNPDSSTPLRINFDQIKKTTDIVRVVESYGITLKRKFTSLFFSTGSF